MTPVPISSGAPAVVTSTIVVAGAGTHLGNLALRTNISHTANGDLDITLRSPIGTIVTVTSDNGGTFDDVFKGTTWSDQEDPGSQIPYPSNPNIVTDRVYQNIITATNLTIEEAMAAFEGENPNGTWTLSISDDAPINGGTLNNWSIDVTTITCDQPCSNPGEVNNSVALVKTSPSGSANVVWSDSPGPFNVYRGLRTTMASWTYNQTASRPPGGPPVPDPAVPALGTTYYYLLTRCFESTLGSGRDKFGNPIPRVNGSPCP
jgi:subtilisin-like proprotein convertase family protein